MPNMKYVKKKRTDNILLVIAKTIAPRAKLTTVEMTETIVFKLGTHCMSNVAKIVSEIEQKNVFKLPGFA